MCCPAAGRDACGAAPFSETPDGVPIHAGDAAWQAGHRPMVKLIAYEKDDSGSVAAQVLKEADALAIVEEVDAEGSLGACVALAEATLAVGRAPLNPRSSSK